MQPALATQPAPPAPAAAAGQANAFTVGGAIARTFSTWWRHVLVFSLLTLVAALPIWAVVLLGGMPVPGLTAPNPNPLDPQAAAALAPGALPPGFWLGYAGTMLLFLVEVGAITHGVIHHLAGKKVSLGAMIGAGLRRAVPLLLVGVLGYLVVGVGTVLLIVPGVYLACALAVAIPAVVVERPGILGALRRSFALTKGKRFSVFVVFLVVFLVAMGVAMFASYGLPALTASISPMAGTLVGALLNLVFGTLLWVAPGVVYHDLRVAKEGVATAQLAAVFE
ncbi:MAG TPA: hypothetical protein VF841_00295 [Anaeromyxobacter sp.]